MNAVVIDDHGQPDYAWKICLRLAHLGECATHPINYACLITDVRCYSPYRSPSQADSWQHYSIHSSTRDDRFSGNFMRYNLSLHAIFPKRLCYCR